MNRRCFIMAMMRLISISLSLDILKISLAIPLNCSWQRLRLRKQENEQIAWLKKHIAEYGFVFRYPEDVNEKGHLVLRYVGVEKAKEMTEKGLRLEDIG